MKYADQIRQAKSTPEALFILATALDEVLAGRAVGSDLPGDEWGEWGAAATATAGPSAGGTPTPDPFAVIKPKVDPQELRDAEEAAHQAEVNFERVRAAGDQVNMEASVLELRRAQARVRQLQGDLEGGIINGAGFIAGTGEVTRTTEGEGGIIVDLPAVDARRKAARRQFAEAINLPSFFPTIMRTGEPAKQIIRAYELGGPIWLNSVGREDGQPPIIKQMPVNVRQAMIEDVRIDSERLAHELASDILNDTDPDTLQVSGENLSSVIGAGKPVYQGRGDA